MLTEQAVKVLEWAGASAIQYQPEIGKWRVEIDGYAEWLSDSSFIKSAQRRLSQSKEVMGRVVEWWNEKYKGRHSIKRELDTWRISLGEHGSDCLKVDRPISNEEIVNDALKSGMTLADTGVDGE